MKTIAAVSALVAVASGAALAPVAVKDYSGYQVHRLSVGENVATINDVVKKLELSTWKGAPKAGAFADIVVPPSKLEQFKAETVDFESVTMHDDLGLSIADEGSFAVYAAGSANATYFNSYHSYADHLTFLKDLQASFPANSAVVTSGNSLNGRAITGIQLFGSSGKGVKPAVIIHGTVHAREWIGGMTVEYLAYTLLSQYSSSTEIKGFVDKYDFYFFPVVNPDGFVYTQTNDRLWRKNRQSTSGSTCIGHDINRNWPYQWSVTGGASTNPCAEDFKGSAQSDAPETTNLAAFITKVKGSQGLKLFIDYHSYSQLFMTPYGYSCTARPTNNAELQTLAAGYVAAIKAKSGLTYEYGPICSTIYQATGSSVDYTAAVAKSDYTFTAELRDTGNNGFVLPASQIVPTGQENWAGFRYLLLNMK